MPPLEAVKILCSELAQGRRTRKEKIWGWHCTIYQELISTERLREKYTSHYHLETSRKDTAQYSSAIVKVPEQVWAAKSAPRKVGNQVPRKGSPLPRESQARVPRFGTVSQARFPGTGSQARFPRGSPKQGSQEEVPKQGSQEQVARNRFPSKVPKQGSQEEVPSKVPRQGYQEQIPKQGFPARGPKQGSQEEVPKQGSQEVPKQGFPGTGSQARFPGTGFASTDFRNRFPGFQEPFRRNEAVRLALSAPFVLWMALVEALPRDKSIAPMADEEAWVRA